MQFKDIIGQEEVKQLLINSCSKGRISHAQLFLGPEGTGNLALALAYAQFINCIYPLANDSCGTCYSCIKYQKLIHPDLHFSFPSIAQKAGEKALSSPFLPIWRKVLIDNPYATYQNWMTAIEAENKQGNISAAECHDMIMRLSLANFEAKYKVLILWLPEFLKNEGNILLKIIEEPPQNTVFLLVAHQIDKILPTILSRTQLIKIPTIDLESLASHLHKQHQIPEEAAHSIALLSNGNYPESLRLIDAEVSVNEHLFKDFMRICYAADGVKLSAWVETASGLGREKQKDFLAYSLHLLRECFLFRFGSASMLRLKGTEKDFVEKFSPFIVEQNIAEISRVLSESSYYIERNANPKITFHCAGIELTRYLQLGKKVPK